MSLSVLNMDGTECLHQKRREDVASLSRNLNGCLNKSSTAYRCCGLLFGGYVRRYARKAAGLQTKALLL